MTERPRDALGRPLGSDDDPSRAVPGIGSTAGFGDDDAWAAGVAYLDERLPFHAHEVFEARWREAPTADRDAWRALAQWAAALTHAARGNPEGARRLAARAETTLARAPHVPGCVDVARVHDSCRALA